MKKKYRKFIYLACFLLIISIVPLAFHLSASAIVKDCNDYMDNWGDYETYGLGYNSHGFKILKHPQKAIKQFKKDHAEGFQFLREVRGYPELTGSYKSVKSYSKIGFGSIKEDIENYDEVDKQVREIMIFIGLLKDSYWQSYAPFYTVE